MIDIKYLIIFIWIVGFVITLVYYDYLVWFQPSKFKEVLTKSIKDWYPFADFWRGWFSSMLYLWIVRILLTAVSLGIVFFVFILILIALDVIK